MEIALLCQHLDGLGLALKLHWTTALEFRISRPSHQPRYLGHQLSALFET